MNTAPPALEQLRYAIDQAYLMDETQCVEQLVLEASISKDMIRKVQEVARQWVVDIRRRRLGKGGLDAFLFEYDLSSEEGIALMCLAEALLRIPDSETIDKLIKDKITSRDWEKHCGKSHSYFVNAATWALMLTGKVISPQKANGTNLSAALKRLTKRSGEPIIRQAVGQAMKILGRQFVMGKTIEAALKRAESNEAKGYRYSYDMLGEAACTEEDAKNYFQSYMTAIEAIGKKSQHQGVIAGPGISVKLSALHPRYEWTKKEDVLTQLVPKILELAKKAKHWNIGLTIDAEEASRLELSLLVIESVVRDPRLEGWHGFGLAVQAYQKRATYVLDWVIELAKQTNMRLMVRLVKGAYWDSEIKWAQEKGLSGYPVFTRKSSTDVSYIACVKKIFAAQQYVYPQFATHNAYTAALVLLLAREANCQSYEFQCLHGMGDTLYNNIVGEENYDIPCRIYAPVGNHDKLLAYLVRRLLENGANSSFVNRIVDERAPIEEIIADPIARTQALKKKPHTKIPLPINLYGALRPNSRGRELSHSLDMIPLVKDVELSLQKEYKAAPTCSANDVDKNTQLVCSPTDYRKQIGLVEFADKKTIQQTILQAELAFETWKDVPVSERAKYLEKLAVLLEKNTPNLMGLLVCEAGKTIKDAMDEIREAIDFCWYYAGCAKTDFGEKILVGPTGETNSLNLHGRGLIVCISPWNFPLAIFLGQVTAALVAGNVVIAKPASQTCLIAQQAVSLLHLAGVPTHVIQLLPASGRLIGDILLNDQRVKGVMFTGSTETARQINQTLAMRPGPIVPFIAETGGLNAMIVDSTALPEQVVMDVLLSAFGSAGQRCSALRVLYLQADIADKMLEMLVGAMALLKVGDPMLLSTDMGPVIDEGARKTLEAHVERMKHQGRLLFETPLRLEHREQYGHFFAPRLYEIDNIQTLGEEVFGPILHVIRFQGSQLLKVIDDINQTGYGLTLGIHSRINEVVDLICSRAKVGNIYINRGMTGAVVGVQPFGGEGLSGTGPKAGGPRYLHRLATERTISNNVAAAGGNASLMSLTEES